VALHKQVEEIFKTAKKHLKDKEHGGFHLNTNFHEMRPDLGRAFSFAYGEKENGAFFSHMAVMFGNALYQRGFVKEGREVLDSIYKMCVRTEKSKIYPGIPEYFNLEGRGFYHYLTGSASWFVMTLLTQVFGVRGRYGDLTLEPKFTADDFDKTGELSVETHFAGKRLRVVYKNPKKISYEHSCITRVTLNGKLLKNVELNRAEVTIPKNFFLQNAGRPLNEIIVTLE
jgi:cellobiose phosphorylase